MLPDPGAMTGYHRLGHRRCSTGAATPVGAFGSVFLAPCRGGASAAPSCGCALITLRRTSASGSIKARLWSFSREVPMSLHLTLGPIVSLLAGILILIVPRLLSYIVAIYLIIIGLLELSGSGGLHI
jgi:hypothetical protein